MNRRRATVLLSLCSVACGRSGESPLAPSAVSAPAVVPARVLILSVDGLRPDALTAPGVAAPSMLGLAQRGAYTWGAQTVSPSETLPSHASMLSGEPPSVHGMTWDDNAPAGLTIPVPTVFSIARAAGLRTAMVASKSKFQHLGAPGTLDSLQITGNGDAAVAEEAVARVRDGYHVLFVHFADVDLAGHARGWMSRAYLDKVCAVDAAIGRILAELPAETTVILTADHGGRGTNHGAEAAENRTIPWVIAGPGVIPHAIARPVRTMDTAATALRVLGLGLPVGAAGNVVAEAFGPALPLSAEAGLKAPGLGQHVALARGHHPAQPRDRAFEVRERLPLVR